MAIKEFYKSRSLHITIGGTSLKRIYHMNSTDLALGRDAQTILPVLGTQWSSLHPDLRVIDINVEWITQVECKVVYTYSTSSPSGSGSFPDNRPGRTSSIVDSFDFTWEPVDVQKWYYNHKTEDMEDWSTLFHTEFNWDDSENKTKDDVPTMLRPEARPVWTVKFNVLEWDYDLIADYIGSVNDRTFLPQVNQRNNPPMWIIANNRDRGQWLFMGFSAVKHGFQNWECRYTFMYERLWTWNTPYGVDAFAYKTRDLNTLPAPTGDDDYESYDYRL